jgi:hypothetical protein
MNAEASEARRAIAGVIVLSSTQPAMTLHSSAEAGKTTSGREVAISEQAFRIGRWTVLATLVHELAHTNGAPDRPSTAAEEAVLACGMGYNSEKTSGRDDTFTPYNPTIRG